MVINYGSNGKDGGVEENKLDNEGISGRFGLKKAVEEVVRSPGFKGTCGAEPHVMPPISPFEDGLVSLHLYLSVSTRTL